MSSVERQEKIKELDEKYGADLLDYEKCKEIYNNLKKEKSDIEKQVDYFSCNYFVTIDTFLVKFARRVVPGWQNSQRCRSRW